MVFVGNDNAHHRISLYLILNLENRLESLGGTDFKVLKPLFLKMGRHGSLCRLDGVALGTDIRSHTARMGAPVIKQFGYVHHTPGPACKTQNHIMVLAAVELWTK